MANTTLTVTVRGGKPPVTIRIRCFKNNKHFLDISSPKSFQHPFIGLKKGEYSIFIMGFNPLNGSTECSLTPDEITLHPPDPSPVEKTGTAYLAAFHFTVT